MCRHPARSDDAFHRGQSPGGACVGVSNYQVAPKLPNSVNDANAIGAALKRVGFSTEIVIDHDRRQFEDAVRRIGQTADGAEASVFYFAGHALEAAGQNLLLPVGANIKSARDLRYETIDLNAILESIAGRSRVSLLFLDSCRDNPFANQLAGTTRSTSFRGLGAVDTTVGTLIAFATAPGKVAEDGDQKNSPFTTALQGDFYFRPSETPGAMRGGWCCRCARRGYHADGRRVSRGGQPRLVDAGGDQHGDRPHLRPPDGEEDLSAG